MAADSDTDTGSIYRLSSPQKWFFSLPLLFGLFWLFVIATTAHAPGSGMTTFAGWQFPLKAAGVLFSGAGTAFASGAFLGFLFGVPKVVQPVDMSAGSVVSSTDNLIGIADWLLKILLGAGLTQFGPLLRTVRKVSGDLGAGVGLYEGTNALANATLIAFSLGYFFTWGCLMSYLLTQQMMPAMLQRNRERLQSLAYPVVVGAVAKPAPAALNAVAAAAAP